MIVQRDSAVAPTRWARNVLACELGSATSVSIRSLRPHRTPLQGVFAGGHRATVERCVHFGGKCHSRRAVSEYFLAIDGRCDLPTPVAAFQTI